MKTKEPKLKINNKAIDKLKIKIAKNLKRIKQIENENYDLKIKIFKNQGYSEHTEVNKKTSITCGAISWTEDFLDEDTGEVVSIVRKDIVTINGEIIDKSKRGNKVIKKHII